MPSPPVSPADDHDLIMDTRHGPEIVPGPKTASESAAANEDLGDDGWAEVREDRLRKDTPRG